MKLLFFIFFTCVKCNIFCQNEGELILKKSQGYYENMREAHVEISATYKNFLKNDTNYYNQSFSYFDGGNQVAKLSYRDGEGYSIYVNSTTYYIYTYNNTYYIGKNATENHLKFLPYWNPTSFFRKYLAAAKSNNMNAKHNEREYILTFKSKDWESVFYIDQQKYSLTRYTETYYHKKYGTQFKEFKLEEKLTGETSESLLNDLEVITKSYTQTTDQKIRESLKEHQKNKEALLANVLNRQLLMEILANENIPVNSTRYILLDYFYQTCFPCIKGIPDLNNIIAEFDSTKLLVVGIDPIISDKGHMGKFKERYSVRYALIDGENALKIKNITLPTINVVYPTMMLIKPDGKIEFILEGYSKEHFRFMISYFKKTF